MVYEPQSQAAIDRLWKETLNELEFADAQGILQNLRKRA